MLKILREKAFFRNLTVCLAICTAGINIALAGSTDPTAVYPDIKPARPANLGTYNDSVFGTQIVRIAASASMLFPEYSQLQAWNADRTKLLLNNGNGYNLYDASTYALIRVFPYGYGGQRWSPKNPDYIFCVQNNSVYRYSVSGNSFTLLRTFTEYANFDSPCDSQSCYKYAWEELSDDGKWMGMLGKRSSDGLGEAFLYNVVDNTKSTPVILPRYNSPGQPWDQQPRFPDWIKASPSGNYLLIQWASGTGQFFGLESYSRTGTYLGQVWPGIGHGDTMVDNNAVEWYVTTNVNNGYCPNNWPGIVKAKIPVGWDQTGPGCNASLANGSIVKMLGMSWWLSTHTSARNILNPSFVVVSVDGIQSGHEGESIPFAPREIFLLRMDSTEANPKVERVAQGHQTTVSGQEPSYYTNSHATVRNDGAKIAFGSDWGANAFPIDTYIINLGTSVPPNTSIPMPPHLIRVQ